MSAVQLVGHGGPEQLVYSDDVPVPLPADGEVLIDVHACGMNNTDVWVREGAYGSDTDPNEVSTWRRGRSTLEFPRIQGADIVGRIAGVGPGVDQDRIGERVMVDFSLYNRPEGDESLADIDYIGHGRDGGYADYVTVPAENAYEVTADVSDAGLATFCCAYLTAEQMLDRARLAAGERILVTGASGGVGSAVIQLARVRGAIPYAVTSVGKESALREIGAEGVLTRDTDDLVAEAARVIDGPVDVVADLVAGPLFNDLLRILRPEGRYTGSPTSSRPSAPSWASRTSASWWWCLTGTGMTWGHTMRRERSLDLIDAQSGGDVSRVVTAGIEPIPGATALEKARYLQREGDGLRR
ncbi:MAG: alcohol dehydrogenase catalytic domain-containing protein, partial [Brevibacterium yomogidense]